MILETIFLATLAFGALRTVIPSNTQGPTPPTTIKTPTTTSPQGTSAIGDGTNNVYNVSFVNNNNTQPVSTPPSTSESAQQYFKKTFSGIHLNDISSTISQYCYENKYYLAASAVFGGYMYMFYRLRTIQSYVNNEPSWGAWKKEVPMEKLLAIPQDKLTYDLMMSVQQRYISVENPTDFLAPLITFSQEITEEKQLVEAYHSYVSWCLQCSLNNILPISQTLLAELAARKQRIIYLSTLFQSWLAHYRLEQINHARPKLEMPKE